MTVIFLLIGLSLVLIGLSFWLYKDWLGITGMIILCGTLIVWGIVSLATLECESLAESYDEELRFDWVTGCMLPLEDGREIQIDEESIVFVVRELIEDDQS